MQTGYMEFHCSIPFKSLSKKLDGNFLLFKMARASSTTVILPALFSFFSILGKIASKLLHSPPAKIRLQWLGDSYTANQTWILPMPLHRLSDHLCSYFIFAGCLLCIHRCSYQEFILQGFFQSILFLSKSYRRACYQCCYNP